MMNLKQIGILSAIIIPTLIFATGCQTAQAPARTGYNPLFDPIPPDVDLSTHTKFVVERLVANTQQRINRRSPILVATIANVDNLETSSTFGRILSEHIGSHLAQLGYNVSEIKLRRNFLVRNKSGEFMISRDLKNLDSFSSAQAVVTGTYGVGNEVVFVSLRVVRLSDSRIIGSHDYSLPVGINTRYLLRGTSAQFQINVMTSCSYFHETLEAERFK